MSRYVMSVSVLSIVLLAATLTSPFSYSRFTLAQRSTQKSISQDGQTASSVDFEVRFVYDFGITKLHLATGRANFHMYEENHNGNSSPFYELHCEPLESGKTPLGIGLTKGIGVTEPQAAHIYVLKNGSTIPRSIEESHPAGFAQLSIVGGIPTLRDHNPAEPDDFRPFWGPRGGGGWVIGLGYGYFVRLSPEDVASIRAILYLQDTYLAFSDESLWGKSENFGNPNTTNVVAFVSEFNRTDEGWVFNKLTAETLNFDKVSFDPNTITLTIYVSSLPSIFYFDTISVIIPIVLVLAILFVMLKKRNPIKNRSKIGISTSQKTQQNPI